MVEYINREKLRDALYEADAITMRGVKICNQFPAADVAPVRHGRWIPYASNANWFCSECGETDQYAYNYDGPDFSLQLQDRYCPRCGARMDKDGDA